MAARMRPTCLLLSVLPADPHWGLVGGLVYREPHDARVVARSSGRFDHVHRLRDLLRVDRG
jgi:hypothetical protein